MTSGGRAGWVSYPQMIDYVDRTVKPLEEHMTAHDAWHLERVTAEQQANRAARLAMLGVWVSVAALATTIVLAVVFRH